MSQCELCGEPMPVGEEMFKYHGYSGPCPKPPKAKADAAPRPGPSAAEWIEISDGLKPAGEHFASMERETLATIAQIEKRIGSPVEYSDDAINLAHYKRNAEYFGSRAQAIRKAIDLIGALADPPVAAPPELEEWRQQVGACYLLFRRAGMRAASTYLPTAIDEYVAFLKASASVAAPPETPRWLPMESAPRDGTPILVHFRHIGTWQVFWSEEPHGKGLGIWCVSDNKNEDRPLRGYHEDDEEGWTTLPDPPAPRPRPEEPTT